MNLNPDAVLQTTARCAAVYSIETEWMGYTELVNLSKVLYDRLLGNLSCSLVPSLLWIGPRTTKVAIIKKYQHLSATGCCDKLATL